MINCVWYFFLSSISKLNIHLKTAVYQNKYITQEKCKHLIIFLPAELKFLNNLSEQPLIVRRRTAVDYMIIFRDMVVFQYSLNVCPGKMHPVNRGAFFLVIPVMLRFIRKKYDHISCGYNMFCTINKKMRFSRRYIEKLIIFSSLVPPGLKNISGLHFIISAACNHKRCNIINYLRNVIVQIRWIYIHSSHSP